MERKICHFESSRRCAIVFTAPKRFVIRVNSGCSVIGGKPGTIIEMKEADMIVVRDIFQLKFGLAGQAIELWKQILEINRKLGYGGTARMLTDLVGPAYYTLVLESTYASMGEFEEAIKRVLKNG